MRRCAQRLRTRRRIPFSPCRDYGVWQMQPGSPPADSLVLRGRIRPLATSYSDEVVVREIDRALRRNVDLFGKAQIRFRQRRQRVGENLRNHVPAVLPNQHEF